MQREVDELFEAVRDACSPKVWSQGVLLARSGEMIAKRIDADELQITIRSSGGMVSPTVSLWPADVDWACNCAAADDGCAHAAAAAIALRDALARGGELPTPKLGTQAAVGYRFRRTPQGLSFSRVLVTAEGELALTGTLSSVAHGGKVTVIASKLDAMAEQLLGTKREGILPHQVLGRLLKTLAAHRDIRLDGVPVRVSGEPVLPMARLVDTHGGFLLQLVDDPRIEEAFANGVALVAGELRARGETGLSARELDELPRGKLYRFGDAATLASEVLPALRAKVSVEVATTRLPRGRAEAPRARVYAERQGDALSVLPTIVYGQPPMARVDQGQLVLLGDGAVPVRDRDAELRVSRALHRDLGLEPGRRVELLGSAALAFADRLRAWSGDVEGRALGEFFRAGALSPRVEVAGGGVEVWFDDVSGESGEAGERGRSVGARTVLDAWRRGESWISLAGGGFSPVPAEWLQLHGERLAALLAAREALPPDSALPPYLAPEVGAFCDELGVTSPPQVQAVRDALQTKTAAWEPPADFAAELREYQREGVRWLALLRAAGLGALLADDMGLGKTVQVLAIARPGTLVVAPTSVLFNWAEELSRFRPKTRICVYHGPQRALDASAHVTLTTYGVLRMDAEVLRGVPWDMVVLDEAQTIKNPSSQVARAAFGLRAPFRVALTGTPVENRLDELWSQFHFLNPALLGSLRDFRERTADPISRGEQAQAERLRERIRPFVLRRLKREVARELPPRTEMVLRCELNTHERSVYDAVLAATRQDVVAKLQDGGSVFAVLEALLRLRQAACHAGLVPGQHAGTSSKVELLREVLEEAASEGHKALVFSQWTSLLDKVEPALEESGLDFVRLDGATRDRQAVVERFQSDDGPPVMLLSLKAGGIGLNLTAADLVILLDPWWNPAAEDQAADRAHRIGQDKPVLIYRFVAADTVEERILALQQRKRALADAAFGQGAHAAAVTRDELLALLS